MKNKNNKTSTVIRPATTADVPAMSSIICTSLAEDAAWKRLCPPQQEVGSLLEEAIDSRRKHVMVLEDESNGVIVSVSVWEDEQRHRSTTAVISSHPATSTATVGGKGSHSCAGLYSSSCFSDDDKDKDKDDDDKDKDKDKDEACLALRLLATRPDCQRRGYGRALASWGVRRAGKRSVPVCVLAAERGYILFSGMGFVDRGLVSLGVCGDGGGGGGVDGHDDEDEDADDDNLCVKTMVLQPLPSRRLRVAKLLSRR
ncbi:hypothetical protein CP532_5501 [Ophiocordyceps camponoti-leonardi (nom. inval.)]|nr:hypothetical protein CP532_5501 [Ophiocordyceps camponoti-leonardi (nom. inval.)]